MMRRRIQPDPPLSKAIAPSLLSSQKISTATTSMVAEGMRKQVKAVPGGSSMVVAFDNCEYLNAHQVVTGPEGVTVDTKSKVHFVVSVGCHTSALKRVCNAFRSNAQTEREFSYT